MADSMALNRFNSTAQSTLHAEPSPTTPTSMAREIDAGKVARATAPAMDRQSRALRVLKAQPNRVLDEARPSTARQNLAEGRTHDGPWPATAIPRRLKPNTTVRTPRQAGPTLRLWHANRGRRPPAHPILPRMPTAAPTLLPLSDRNQHIPCFHETACSQQTMKQVCSASVTFQEDLHDSHRLGLSQDIHEQGVCFRVVAICAHGPDARARGRLWKHGMPAERR